MPEYDFDTMSVSLGEGADADESPIVYVSVL